MAWPSGAVKRLRGFASPDVMLRMLLLESDRPRLEERSRSRQLQLKKWDAVL